MIDAPHEQPDPPLSPKFRATARMVASHDCGWEEATDLVERTFYGRQAWMSEALLDLGRTIAKETPFRQILGFAHKVGMPR